MAYLLDTLPEKGILAHIINGRKKIFVNERLPIVSKGQICYFNGTIGGSLKVFVKRVPIGREDLQERVEKAYAHLDRLEAVVKLMLVERDNHFVYYAFEKFDYSLDTCIKGHPKISEVQIIILSSILIPHHSYSTLHANICPEHILLKFRDDGPYLRARDDIVVIKFCEVDLRQKSRKEFKQQHDAEKHDAEKHDAEKHALGRTYLNLWTKGIYSFKEGDITPCFVNHQFTGYDLTSLDSFPIDLIGKLVFPHRGDMEVTLHMLDQLEV
ncbi:glutamine--tRNA ligase [Tanacetum coccineum]